MLRRITTVFICLIMVGGLFFVSAEKPDTTVSDTAEIAMPDVADGYSLITQDGKLILFADKNTGDFAVYDTEAKQLWYSGQREVLDNENPISQLNFGRVKTDLVSMLSLNYVQISTIASTAVPLYQNSYAYCVSEGNVEFQEIENGYRADYYFADIDITVPVNVILKDGCLLVGIIGKEIKKSDDYRLVSISLLPGFMAGDDRNDGYLFVPSGSGALVPFASGRGEIATYSEMVYGDDIAIEQEEYEGEKQKISVPVYGIKRSNSAITAIITEGDSSARISAEADSLSSSFTRVYSEYITSIIDSTTLFESNFENQRIIYGAEDRDKYSNYSVKYTFLSGQSANYSGMAEVYRKYINLTSKAQKPELRLTLYGGAERKASFLGIPYKKKVALTSFEQTEEIISRLKEQNTDVSIRYIGWNNNGIDNKKVSSKVKPMSVLGGKKGFESLHKSAEKAGVSLWFDTDIMFLQKSGNGFSVFSDVCKSIFNTRTPIYDYMRSVYVPVNNRDPHYLLTPDNVQKSAFKFLKSYKYNGGISFSDLSNSLYSDFKGKKERDDCIEYIQSVYEKVPEKNSIAVATPNAYVFKYADTVYDIPVSNDGNLLFSQSVPFLQMVLHGIVSYGATPNSSLLDCIEYGADPSFYSIYADASDLMETDYNWLYGTTYNNLEKDAVDMFNEYKKVYADLYDCMIVGHSSENGISKTVFDNGTVIYVNRNETDAVVDGHKISAGGYCEAGGAG